MKRLLLTALLACSAGLGASPALAQGYVGLSVGESNVDVDCSGTTVCDKRDTAFKIFGGYMYSPNWGAEVAYYDQGKVKVAGNDDTFGLVTGDFRGRGFALFGVGAMPFDRFSVFGKLGVASVRVKGTVTSTVPPVQASDSETHSDFAWGVGASYDFSKTLGVRAEFERLRVKFQDEKMNADLFSIGLVYRF